MSETWPWLVFAGLGAYHGLNPAMGWLFAVALGLHRRSHAVLLRSMIPIALGHALSVGTVAALVLAAGVVLDTRTVRAVAGAALILWAAWHVAFGHRHRARVGMRTGAAGLALWSFLMAGAHGAGLMVAPALIPLCLSGSGAGHPTVSGSALASLAAVGLHTAAMLTVTGLIAVVVYEWIGLGFLRRGWINLDLLWTASLVATGGVLLVP